MSDNTKQYQYQTYYVLNKSHNNKTYDIHKNTQLTIKLLPTNHQCRTSGD